MADPDPASRNWDADAQRVSSATPCTIYVSLVTHALPTRAASVTIPMNECGFRDGLWEDTMRAKVSSRGLFIPKKLLVGIEEVEILKEEQRIVIWPLAKADPILDLGKHPVHCGVSDGAELHDNYLYTTGP